MTRFTPSPALLVFGLSVSLLAGGCSPMKVTSGNLLQENVVQQIQPSTSTRADVQSKWGPPSTVSAFDPNVWYYIGETTARKGVFAPEIEQRRVVKVVFNGDDTVQSVTELSQKDRRDIELTEGKTPTAGKEFTALQQFVGNLGKFNTDSPGKRSSPGAGN